MELKHDAPSLSGSRNGDGSNIACKQYLTLEIKKKKRLKIENKITSIHIIFLVSSIGYSRPKRNMTI